MAEISLVVSGAVQEEATPVRVVSHAFTAEYVLWENIKRWMAHHKIIQRVLADASGMRRENVSSIKARATLNKHTAPTPTRLLAAIASHEKADQQIISCITTYLIDLGHEQQGRKQA